MATIRKNVSSKTGKVTWTARAWAEGRDTEKTFKTKREAQDWAAKLEHDKRDGSYINPRESRLTFGEAFENMMKSKRLSMNSREAYRGCFTKHLASIANRPLRAVATDRDGIAALCVDHPLGRRMLAVIRNTCDEAVKSGKLTGHRLQGLTANAIPGKRDLIPVTAEQVGIMADAMGPDGLAIRIAHATGMRVSEVLALRKSDFRQKSDGKWQVHIQRQKLRNGTISVLKARKDFTGRNAPVPAAVACLVMARDDGELFACKHTSFRTRFRTAVKKAGLPRDFIFHQFKHNFVTDMVAGGLTFTDISPWVGTSARVLAETYAHLSPTAEDRALSILEGRSVTLRAA